MQKKQNSDAHINFFKCPICSFRTPLRGDLQKHISMYHKQVFVCNICTSKFSRDLHCASVWKLETQLQHGF